MRLRKRKQVHNICTNILSVFCVILSTFCFCIRLPSAFLHPLSDLPLLSARFLFPSGSPSSPPAQSLPSAFSKNNEEPHPFLTIGKASPSSLPSSFVEPDEDEPSEPSSEKTYKIIESQFRSGGTKFENFFVRNRTSYPLDIAKELSLRPDIKIALNQTPQVLIFHTHTTESYMSKDQGFYYESFTSRSQNENKNVTRVGAAIAQKLTEHGFGVIHDKTVHDNPTFSGSYSRSAETISRNLEQYPSIQVVLDIHRDALNTNDNDGKVKPTFFVNGKKAAQIMIISGCDTDGSLGFPDWEYNLRFALKLQKEAESLYPGMTRPLSFGNVKYNMNKTHGSLLIEVGSDGNTLGEAVLSGSLLGEALSHVLSDLTD